MQWKSLVPCSLAFLSAVTTLACKTLNHVKIGRLIKGLLILFSFIAAQTGQCARVKEGRKQKLFAFSLAA